MSEFSILERFVASAASSEEPNRILEISAGDSGYGRVLRTAMAGSGAEGGIIDRIALPGSPELSDASVYDSLRTAEALNDTYEIGTYDFILILDLFERAPDAARVLLEMLCERVTRQVLVLTPMLTNRGIREHHPVKFISLDFCYSLIETEKGVMQAYGVFPRISYQPLSIDAVTVAADTHLREDKRPLKIAFILPHSGLTGGMKALLTQMAGLTRRGHTVSAYLRSNTARSALPEWSGLSEGACAKQVVIPEGASFTDYITDTDIIFLGWLAQIPEFMDTDIPVVLWEQGSEMMFGDYKSHLQCRSPSRAWMHRIYRLPVHLLAVSEINIRALKGVYNRDAALLGCGIDTELYHPGEKGSGEPTILLVGSPALAFKGFRLALDAIRLARESGARFTVKWAAQCPPGWDIGGDIELIINPPQTRLAELYRRADIYLSTSLYESHPLPPIEAMSSGTAVVATDNGGIHAYAEDGVNCVLCSQGDAAALSEAIVRLIRNPEERDRLAEAGRRTALEHSTDRLAERLERLLLGICGA